MDAGCHSVSGPAGRDATLQILISEVVIFATIGAIPAAGGCCFSREGQCLTNLPLSKRRRSTQRSAQRDRSGPSTGLAGAGVAPGSLLAACPRDRAGGVVVHCVVYLAVARLRLLRFSGRFLAVSVFDHPRPRRARPFGIWARCVGHAGRPASIRGGLCHRNHNADVAWLGNN